MVVYQKRSKRKSSGGRYKTSEKKRLANMGSIPTLTKIGKRKVKVKRTSGGAVKYSLLSADNINVLNPKTKKTQKSEILTVVESPANRNFIRRNIITKGTILETKLGNFGRGVSELVRFYESDESLAKYITALLSARKDETARKDFPYRPSRLYYQRKFGRYFFSFRTSPSTIRLSTPTRKCRHCNSGASCVDSSGDRRG